MSSHIDPNSLNERVDGLRKVLGDSRTDRRAYIIGTGAVDVEAGGHNALPLCLREALLREAGVVARGSATQPNEETAASIDRAESPKTSSDTAGPTTAAAPPGSRSGQ